MQNLILLICLGLVGEALQTPQLEKPMRQPLDVTDLESYNCNSVIEGGTCANECGLNECYDSSSISGTTFPQNGFCAVFNTSQPFYYGVDWYSVSARICLSSSSYPQGTGLLFNYKDPNDYEVVYKTSQDATICYVGYVQNGVVRETGSFTCSATTADQWHRYTVTVYSNKTFVVTLSTQAGNSTTSGTFPTNYPMTTRGGALIVNDGSPGKVLQFDEITVKLSTDCDSSICGSGGRCINGSSSPTCSCYPGYTGVRCETALPPVIYFLEYSSPGYINNLTSDGVQTRITSSGGTAEHGLAIDIRSKLLFYSTTGTPDAVWRADLDDIAGTQTVIWNPNIVTVGLDLSATDRVVFADDSNSIAMLSYDGTLISRLSVTKSSYSYGLAVDEIQRVLYFTDYFADRLWKVSFTPTSFIGSASVILQGAAVGEAGESPVGLVLDGDMLYWILLNSGDILSMPVTGSTSTIVVPAEVGSGYYSHYLSKKANYLYFTRYVSDGGVYRVAAGGTREKITTNPTLNTLGIDVY